MGYAARTPRFVRAANAGALLSLRLFAFANCPGCPARKRTGPSARARPGPALYDSGERCRVALFGFAQSGGGNAVSGTSRSRSRTAATRGDVGRRYAAMTARSRKITNDKLPILVIAPLRWGENPTPSGGCPYAT